jgi:molybdopterin biosynthesis enzyme
MIELAEALALVEATAAALPPRRQRLLDACGRPLAAGVIADCDSPPWDRAMMDGFAVRNADLADEGGATETGMERLLAALTPGQPFCFSDRRKDLRHATSLHGLLPEALQYLLPTEADWLTDYGMALRCENRGVAAP